MARLSRSETERLLVGLRARREAAIDAGDVDELNRIDERIAKLDTRQATTPMVLGPSDTAPPRRAATTELERHDGLDALDSAQLEAAAFGHAPVTSARRDPPPRPMKSRGVAAVLAILLGGLGAHKFYLGKPIQGLIYLIFCWTWIPAILGLIEGVVYLAGSDESFARKYGARV